jgi:hypothetical protein
VTLGSAWVASGASAASITRQDLGDLDSAFVLVSGIMTSGDAATIAGAIQGIGKGVVAFNSDGGDLVAGLEIGKQIRLRGLMTLVASGDRCVSACALAWLGGAKRFLQRGSAVGFHATYKWINGSPIETGVGNALVGAYLANLDLQDAAIVYITESPPESVTWLSPDDSRRLGIDVYTLPDTQLSSSAMPKDQAKPTNVAGSSLVERTATFMDYYWHSVSGTNDFAFYYLSTTYGDVVDYFGKRIPKSDASADKRRFLRAWSERS